MNAISPAVIGSIILFGAILGWYALDFIVNWITWYRKHRRPAGRRIKSGAVLRMKVRARQQIPDK